MPLMSVHSLREAAAQLVMPRLEGRRLHDHDYRTQVEELVREGIGGFILFGGDIETTPHQLRELQSLAGIPLLISSDIERGLGQQLSGATRFPGQRAVASAIHIRVKKDRALLNGMLDGVRTETRAAGIHVVFSPVMDVNSNPDNPIICTRAFGEEPEVVEWFGSRYISRLQKPRHDGMLDVLACAKHFPGHGDTDQDSHSVLPVITGDKARLNRIELPPFRQAVKDGVAMVMIAHLLVPAFDPEKPTTFSKKIVTALLREGIAFDGLISSDALDMGALTSEYSHEEIAIRAVEAGIDILLHPSDARIAINALVSAVTEGRLTEERIQESAQRILKAKAMLGLFKEGEGSRKQGASEKHRLIARDVARKAVRVLGGDKRRLPLNDNGKVACFLLDDDGEEGIGSIFMEAMGKYVNAFSGIVLNPSTMNSSPMIADTVRSAKTIVVAIFSRISATKGRSGISSTLSEVGHAILKTAREAGKSSVFLSFDSPYILETFRGASLRIAAYDRMDEIQTAAAELLSGRIDE